MNKKYRIGFFSAVCLVVFLMGAGYQLSYQNAVKKQQAKAEVHIEPQESITTKGEAEKNEGYYLCELHGYVVVYLGDKETIYEITEISMDSLPQEVQGEVRAGKYVATTAELYAFLENYSS